MGADRSPLPQGEGEKWVQIDPLSLRAEESPEKVKGTMKCDLLVALTNQKRPHRAFKDSVPEILFLVFTRDSFFPH
ncbi:hypothetical protein MRY16398_41330 [Phytobacter sp. MRY16-398]|nr:hypothetical protein MRY16398_41330 [Phytobacter sp. MRY16-398]